jgi:hypothetical protein
MGFRDPKPESLVRNWGLIFSDQDFGGGRGRGGVCVAANSRNCRALGKGLGFEIWGSKFQEQESVTEV